MKSLYARFSLAMLTASLAILLLTGCNGLQPPTITQVAVRPPNVTMTVGDTRQFKSSVVYSDGSTHDVTAQVTWSSSLPAAATIAPGGLATAVAPGNTVITGALGTESGSTTLTVIAAAPATVGAANANALLTATASSRFAYSGNANDGTISIYAVNPAKGTFFNRGFIKDNGGPTQVIPELSGRYAYALNRDGTIGIYNVDPVSGSLTASASAPANPVPNAGSAPSEGVIDPTGHFLYVANQANGNVTAYAIDLTTGGLSPLKGSPYTVGSAPFGLVTDRNGKFLYVTNSGSNNVFGFAISPGGALTRLSTTPAFPLFTGAGPFFPAVSPSNILYVPNKDDSTVSAFTIGADGSLAAVTGSPFSSGVGTGPVAVAVDPSGKYLYVTNNGAGTVSGLTIGADGALGAALPGSPYPGASATSRPVGITVDPAGTYVAVVNQHTNNISLYSLNSSTGVLTPTLTAEARQLPFFVNIYSASVPPIIAPAAVFAANSLSNDVSAFTVTESTGALTAAGSSPFAGAPTNGLAASDLGGHFFYTAGPATPGKLAAFSVTPSTAALNGLSGSPYALTGANSTGTVLADPSGQFVYVAGTGATGSIFGYQINTTTNSLNPITGSPFASVANLKALVMDPQGVFVFALGNNIVQPAEIDAASGTLATGTSTAATGHWTAGAVDSSGQFLLALDSVAKTIQVFSIAPAALNPATDGTLTAVWTAVSVGGTLPSSIVIDPFDRFVFVTDAKANTITTFSFNVTTGAVVQVGSPLGVSSSAGQAAVDASGTYLYVAQQGGPESVAVYKIGSTGTLTAISGSLFTAGDGTTGVAISNSIQ